MSAKLLKCVPTLVLSLALVAGNVAAQDGTLTGTLADAGNGTPIVSAGIEILGVDLAPALSGGAGRFSVSLPVGTYSVVVTALGYREHREDGVRVRADETTVLDLSLTSAALRLNPVVVTASRRAESRTDAPNTVYVVGETEIQERAVVTPVDHLRSAPGVDIIQQGTQSRNVVIRGFNNIFSGSLHFLVDNRIAGVPSLRANLLHFVPQTNEDLERIEVVLGPGSALYGPNTSNGVVHMITRSPLTSQGTTVTLGGGGKNVFDATFRTAHKLSDNFGFKVSARQITGDEWEFTDPAETAARASADSNPAAFKAERMARGLSSANADLAFGRVGIRDYEGSDFKRQSMNVRADWGLGGDDRIVFDYGMTNTDGIELTGLGMGQTNGWKYQYYQARMNAGRFFTQFYLNTSDAGDSYLLRDGAPLTDQSRMTVGQLQHGFDILDGRQDFTYGLDYFYTNPRTDGTINGRNENDDDVKEVGTYIQSKTALGDQLDLILAGRLDTHSRLDHNVLSPRAALVFEPAENHSIRASYNRAFSTPSTLNMFLDISGGPAGPLAAVGYRVQAQGAGSGISLHNADGTLSGMRIPQALGGSGQLMPVGTGPLWLTGVGAANALGIIDAATAGFLASLNPSDTDIPLNMLDAGTGAFSPLNAAAILDVERLKETTSTTFELGYQGVINNKVLIAADVWHSRKENFVSPLVFRTPVLYLDATSMIGFLVPRLTQLIMATTGLDAATAGAAALEQATQLALGPDKAVGGIPGLAETPLAVISSDQVESSATNLLVSYVNAGDVSMYGADFSIQAFLDDHWTLSSTASLVSDDYFDLTEMSNGISPIALNAPKLKGTFGLAYRDVRAGFNAETRLRLTSGFPAESAGFVGTQCETGLTGALYEEPCVDGYQLVDVTVGYKVPGTLATLQLVVNNLFNTPYRSFVGVPEIGRFIMVQAKYDLF
jgi:iron complex outermembrane receptor protein